MISEEDLKIFEENHELTNEYLKKVVHPLLPNASIESIYSLNNIIEAKYGTLNETLLSSKFYLQHSPKKNLFLIHYTPRLQTVFDILNDQAVKMFDLNYQDDPQELMFAAKNLGLDKDFELERFKDQLFIFSACLFDQKKKDSFDMWRLYGGNGNGAALVLEIENNHRINWKDYYLGKAIYASESEDFLVDLKELQNRHLAFCDQNKRFSRTYNPLIENLFFLCGFYKNSIYKIEDEVRLLNVVRKDPDIDACNYDDTKNVFCCSGRNKNHSHYSLLNLTSIQWRKRLRIMINDPKINYEEPFPRVKIKKIILGYKHSEKDRFDIQEIVANTARILYGYHIDVELSDWAAHFK